MGIMGLRKEKASRLAGHWHETQGEKLMSTLDSITSNSELQKIPAFQIFFFC